MNRRDKRSGIYLLPNLLTTASLFAAFYSIVASLKGQYDIAVLAIYLGMIADGLDGRIARLTNTETAFGAEYDSLADMVTSGVAPALLLYSWSLHALGKLGWLVAFIYTVAVALRLARFNTQVDSADKKYFQGLACPSAAAIMSSFVWVSYQNGWSGWVTSVFTALLCLSCAILMVSNIRYYSFKEIDFKGRVPFLYLLLIALFYAAIASNPAVILFIISIVYGLSGPWQTLLALQRLRLHRKEQMHSRTPRGG